MNLIFASFLRYKPIQFGDKRGDKATVVKAEVESFTNHSSVRSRTNKNIQLFDENVGFYGSDHFFQEQNQKPIKYPCKIQTVNEVKYPCSIQKFNNYDNDNKPKKDNNNNNSSEKYQFKSEKLENLKYLHTVQKVNDSEYLPKEEIDEVQSDSLLKKVVDGVTNFVGWGTASSTSISRTEKIEFKESESLNSLPSIKLENIFYSPVNFRSSTSMYYRLEKKMKPGTERS